MSTHPNAMIFVAITPDELARKTFRAIADDVNGEDADYDYVEFKIGDRGYRLKIMEESYDESDQISAREGDIVAHDFLTYGYGATIAWDDVVKAKDELEAWAKGVCERHKCSFKIFITANYW